ncbi:Tm-1-like ATP-binding domain-containing protein [Desulfobacula phenolica]|uniref:Uncharacterized protein, UPF0261 family n=1 Tax=Desulfobacula phenolica TaxID=90732 RepID=A0A1H2KC67_9BACT|nr:Tm-1-like ATP-binding domain-containing protein [Desulfobacula phenolica]SDU66193.1 Uncharacterized protein, UPF0261 family [Desulfobacula phenolica]
MKKGNIPVLLVSTMDTKEEETRYVYECLNKQNITPLIMDAGIRGESPPGVAVTRSDVIRASGKTSDEIKNISSEGEAMEVMINGATKCALSLYNESKIQGIIGLGGSMGTTLGTGIMRAFPIGFPKVMISTMGAQNMRTFVGTRDILVLNSVSDLAGLNRMTRKILHNGASAISGMTNLTHRDKNSETPLAFLTTMGPTETCAKAMRQKLGKKGIEVVTFHSIGTGGAAMERMIQEEKVNMVVDLSLHELMDRHFGGAFDPGPNRTASAIRAGIPTILVPGNMDFIVSGPMEQAKKNFPGRKYHKHNAHITCMSTQLEEIRQIAELLADRCNKGTGLMAMLIPMKGFSDFSKAGGPLTNPEGPSIFAETFKKFLKRDILFECLPYHINDEAFIDAIFDSLNKINAFKSIKRAGIGTKNSTRYFNNGVNLTRFHRPGKSPAHWLHYIETIKNYNHQELEGLAPEIKRKTASFKPLAIPDVKISDIESFKKIKKETSLMCQSITQTFMAINPQLKALITGGGGMGGMLSIVSEFTRQTDSTTKFSSPCTSEA